MAGGTGPSGPTTIRLSSSLALYPELRDLLAKGEKLLVHQEELGDRICGLVAGYLLWAGLVPYGPQAISVIERLTGRQLGPEGAGVGGVCRRPSRFRVSEYVVRANREHIALLTAKPRSLLACRKRADE